MKQPDLWGKELEMCKKSLEEQVIEPRSPRIKEVNRDQLQLRMVNVEKLVGEDHPVRAIWALTGLLDLSKYYSSVQALEGLAGRPPLDPKVMICLWIYGYSTGVSSARQISRLCEYDPAYQWLTGCEPVNHHSMSDFRVNNKKPLDDLFIQVLGLLSSEGLVTLERVMQDGTRIRAYAGGNTFRREKRIRRHLKIARDQVQYLSEQEEGEGTSARMQKAKERAAKEKATRLEKALKELEKMKRSGSKDKGHKEPRVSTTDPEARVMKHSDGGCSPSYNAQISTDAQAGIIVGTHVTQSGSDSTELISGVNQVEKNLGRMPKQSIADGGYSSWDNVIWMENKGIDFIGSIADPTNIKLAQMKRWGIDREFWDEEFSYNEAENIYTCPAGKVLKYKWKNREKDKIIYKYRADATDCGNCLYKHKCCPKMDKGRVIRRKEHIGPVASFIAKMQSKEAKEAYKKRAQVSEFPNAWIKTKIGLRQFKLQGLIKVGIEMLWACLAYNIQQWIRLIWRPQFASG